ncbi:MAG: hypothetical protein HC828_15160 [Blastochloris sp.]|nr:hypothetical protein [Blastochloris sp.]
MVVQNTLAPPGEGVICNVRVDYHDQPLMVLRRLVAQHEAEALEQHGYHQADLGNLAHALEIFTAARAQAPDATTMQFWQAMLLADRYDQHEEAYRLFHDLVAREPQWRDVAQRLLRVERFMHPERIRHVLTDNVT